MSGDWDDICDSRDSRPDSHDIIEELNEQIDALRAENERLRSEHRIMSETLTAAQEIATRETLRRRDAETLAHVRYELLDVSVRRRAELEAEVGVLRALAVTP